MGRISGYTIALRLCEYFVESGLSFPLRCKIFGPLYWETLNDLEKLYFKQLATQYRATPTGWSEKYGPRVNDYRFLAAVFDQRAEEMNRVKDVLMAVGTKMANMSYEEIGEMM